MEFLDNILMGFQVLLDPVNILLCCAGVLMGTLVGILPGIGPVGAIAILLPATFNTSPTSTFILLAGIYYGSQYGGSTTSILVNIPGEATTIVTCIDGYQMAKKGRAGPALAISAWGSFIAGTVSVFALMVIALPLAEYALEFGPPEYFALMLAGLVLITSLAQESFLKAMMMMMFGLLLGTIGLDIITGLPRFTFRLEELTDGLGIVPIAMGLFGLGEVFVNIDQDVNAREMFKSRIKNLWPSFQDWMDSKWAIVRGTIIGFILGILPGAGPVLATFTSYSIEQKLSKHPEKFGHGAIEGVAGPETANNAAAGAALVPLLSLGIPTNVTMAMLFAAFLLHGIQPGPLVIVNQPDLFWGLIASMYLGNVLLLVLNLPLIGLWVQVLKIPGRILFPLIIMLCLIGTYTVDCSSFDLILLIIFGALSYFMKKFGFEPVPLILAFIIGPRMENSLRQTLLISGGNFSIFFSRPISVILLAITAILIIASIFPFVGERRRKLKFLEE